MKKSIIFLITVFMFYSCLNYIPCRGQDYIVENITHQELINKFHELRKVHPEYYAGEDHINEHVPNYYIDLYWKDLNLTIGCDIHIGDQIPNPPTHIEFTLIRDSKGYKDINSKELDEKLNEQYIKKFETEVLDKLGIKWKREKCW